MSIPPILYEFYDQCKGHFINEYAELVAGYIANIETAKRLKDENTNGRLLNFFDIKLDSLNFGTKHQTFIDAAKECDVEIKYKLKECGSELQKLAEAGRERTVAAARTKLQACNVDFAIFGKDLWKNLCRRTSIRNILDQHFTVRSINNADTAEQDKEDESTEFSEVAPPDGSTRYIMWPMSTWLYNAAIHDSKKAVDIEIRRRRAQKIKSAAEAKQIQARQTLVDLRADAAKPEDAAKLLGQRFKQIDQEVASIKDGMEAINTSLNASDRAATRVSTNTTARRPNLDQQTMATDSRMQDVPKNDIPADSADRQHRSAMNSQDSKRSRNNTPATTAGITPLTDTTLRNVMRVPGSRPMRPPSQDHANNDEETSQHQRTGHQHPQMSHQERRRNGQRPPSQPQEQGWNQRQGQGQWDDKPQGGDKTWQQQDEEWRWQRRIPWRGRGRSYGYA